MSWSGNIVAHGKGSFGLRLMIEGWPYEYVTSNEITHATNAATRKVMPGLQFSGLKIQERAVLRDAWSECGGNTFKINPTTTAEETLDSFTRTPIPLGYLASGAGGVPGLTPTSTSVSLDNGLFLTPGYYHIATECLLVTNGANAIARAQWDTRAQKHSILYSGVRSQSVPIYAYPPTMQGRRCFLYAYGTGDNLAGDGVQIWIGIVSRPPRMSRDGISWEIAADSVMHALDQSVAAAPDIQYQGRGIYHSHSAPLSIVTIERALGGAPQFYSLAQSFGFFETQADFVNNVNSTIASTGTFTTVSAPSYEERTSSGPTISYTVNTPPPSSALKAFFAVAVSAIEGDLIAAESVEAVFDGNIKLGDDRTFSAGGTDIAYFGDGSGAFEIANAVDGQEPPFKYPLSPVRGCVGVPARKNGPRPLGFSFGNTYLYAYSVPDPSNFVPNDRVYLNQVEGLAIGNVIVVRNGDRMAPLLITGVDTTNRFISVSIQSGDSAVYYDDKTQFIPLRVFKTDTNLAGFVTELLNQAVNANDGDTPYVTPGDIDNSALISVFGTASLDVYWQHRNYCFFKPTPIKTIMAEELKLLGYMTRLDVDGRISFVALPVVSATTNPNYKLTDNDILYPAGRMAGQWPAWEAQSDGIINIINVRLGYNMLTDDFDESLDFSVRSVSSISEHKSMGKGQAEIAPVSQASCAPVVNLQLPQNIATLVNWLTGGASLQSPTQVVAWTQNYLRVLSMDYATVTIAVSFKYFGALIGDIVDVTCAFIPNSLGTRGVVTRRATVVGREWSLDPASGSMGTLTLYFPRDISGGYTPSARITSQTGSGGAWSLTIGNNFYNTHWSAEGDGLPTHFAVGDYITITQVDTTTPIKVNGHITGIPTSNTFTVSMLSTWTPGGSTWNLTYGPDNGNLTASQHQYVMVADTTRTREDGRYADRYL